MTRQTPTKPHHHGNLRQALIDAAVQLIETGGPAALTLRKCARLAGVSHAAPAHHFNGLLGLQAAVVARAHKLFAATMIRHADEAAQDPLVQLAAICAGYLEFAQTHNALFKFMFQPKPPGWEQVDELTASELAENSTAAYMVLRTACSRFEQPGDDPAVTETLVWSLIHGYAMLFANIETTGPEDHPIPDFSEILPLIGLKPIG